MQGPMQASINATVGIVGAAVTYMFGGWSELVNVFLLLIAVDYVTGVAASIKSGEGLCSTKGFWGIWKKGLMLIIVTVGHRFDLLLGTDLFMVGFMYFYISNELLSITENCGKLGFPLPERLRKLIQVLREKGIEKEEDPK